MNDAVTTSLQAVARGSAWAYPLVFVAGLATSIGPCVAPRYVAVAAFASSARHPRRATAAFGCGIVGAYVAIGSAAGFVTALRAWSTLVYAVLAVTLMTAGLWSLLLDDSPRHAHAARVPVSIGGTLLLGVVSAVVASPCCTPIVAGIAGLTIVSGRPYDGAALLACFALGHVAPALLAGTAGTRAVDVVVRIAAGGAAKVVGATLMLALGAYYGVLA